jgi:hypothetical protein
METVEVLRLYKKINTGRLRTSGMSLIISIIFIIIGATGTIWISFG